MGANSLFVTELLMLRTSAINPFTTYKREEQIALINYEAIRVALNAHTKRGALWSKELKYFSWNKYQD